MRLDREFQHEILTKAGDLYPGSVTAEHFTEMLNRRFPDGYEKSYECNGVKYEGPRPLMTNLHYLQEHNLLEVGLSGLSDTIPNVRITAKGIDFLADDGGLSAILSTVTVKFDADNIRELLAQGLLKVDLPEEKKSLLKKAIDGASSTALQTVTSKLIEFGMSNPTGAAKVVAGVFGITI